jgi:acyl-CoA thioesterase-1
MRHFARRLLVVALGLGVLTGALIGAASCDSKRNSITGPSGGDASRIVVLGDSLALSPSTAEAFPAILQARLDDMNANRRIVNNSVSGDTTGAGLARLNAILTDPPAILILELGANDGLQGLSIATIRDNLDEIIVRAKAEGVRVLLCGMETPPLHGIQYSFDFHEIYPALATKHNMPLVPFLLAGVIGNPSMNQPDGIHPNAAGARRIADNVWAHLLPLLQSTPPSLVSQWH